MKVHIVTDPRSFVAACGHVEGPLAVEAEQAIEPGAVQIDQHRGQFGRVRPSAGSLRVEATVADVVIEARIVRAVAPFERPEGADDLLGMIAEDGVAPDQVGVVVDEPCPPAGQTPGSVEVEEHRPAPEKRLHVPVESRRVTRLDLGEQLSLAAGPFQQGAGRQTLGGGEGGVRHERYYRPVPRFVAGGAPDWVIWPGWLTRDACEAIRRTMDRSPVVAAEVVDGGYVVDGAIRTAGEVEVPESLVTRTERRMLALRQQMSDTFEVALTGGDGPAFLRYGPGGFYRRHRDAAGEHEGPESRRRVSVVLFLNSAGAAGDFEGGHLRFYDDDSGESVDLEPVAGTLVAFRSQLSHEVLPIERGVRDVVVDWFW